MCVLRLQSGVSVISIGNEIPSGLAKGTILISQTSDFMLERDQHSLDLIDLGIFLLKL